MNSFIFFVQKDIINFGKINFWQYFHWLQLLGLSTKRVVFERRVIFTPIHTIFVENLRNYGFSCSFLHTFNTIILLLQIHMNKDNKILHIGRIKINYSIISKVWLLQYPSIKKVWFPYQKQRNSRKKKFKKSWFIWIKKFYTWVILETKNIPTHKFPTYGYCWRRWIILKIIRCHLWLNN